MAIDSNVLQEVIDALKQDPEIKNNVYQATVSRIDGEGVVWVNIAGSDTETPTAITSAEVAPGDAVNVEWRNNKLYIGGNYSNPSAGVGRVAIVEELANNAVTDAVRARTAADSAEASATEAKATADAVHGIAVQAQEDAEEASTAAATASTQAQAASTAAASASTQAQAAATAASNAQTSATQANTAANGALSSLSTVQDVIGVLDWASKNAEYTLTSDTAITPGKTYWTRSGAGTEAYPYIYTPVVNPVVADIGTYYEISGVDEAMADYINSHLALTDEGLYVLADASGYKYLVTNLGAYVISPDGDVITTTDYHSLQLKDRSGQTYLHVSDLLDYDGYVTDTYTADGTQTTFNLSTITSDVTSISVTVDGSAASNLNKTTTGVTFYSAPAANSIVRIKYIPADSDFKAYTIGTRKENNVIGVYSVVEGVSNIANGKYSHAGGYETVASGDYSHAEGAYAIAKGHYSHAEGNYTTTTAAGSYAHAEGRGTTSAGSATHAEGWYSKAEGHYSHAEGRSTTTTALAEASHAEGYSTTASGEYAHAEGESTTASSEASHAEGESTVASALSAHAEGLRSVASNSNAHAQNLDTRATKNSQTALGTYNIADASSTTTHPSGGTHFGRYAVIVGNGTADNARSNAATLDWSGNLETDGDITDGTGNVLSDKIGEDANGDISITRNITAGGNVEAAGNVANGNGFVLGKIPLANAALTASTNTNITSGSWRSINQFTGYAKTNTYMDSDFFANDTNGFKVLKKGVYRITATVHFNAAANNNAYGIRIFDYNANTSIGNYNYCYANGIAFTDVALEIVSTIDANHIIMPQYERYSGSANWRPQTAEFTIQLIALA